MRFGISLLIIVGHLGCRGDASFLAGSWTVDVQATIDDGNSQSGLKLGPLMNPKDLKTELNEVLLDFTGGDTVTVKKGEHSVTRQFSVIRSQGNTVALSIHQGPHRFKRVTAVQDGAQIVLIDSHQRLILKRR